MMVNEFSLFSRIENESILNDPLFRWAQSCVNELLSDENLLSKLTDDKLQPDILSLNAAVRNKRFELMDALIKQYAIVPDESTLGNAISSGNIDIVKKFVETHSIHVEEHHINCAEIYKHTDIEQYLKNEIHVVRARWNLIK